MRFEYKDVDSSVIEKVGYCYRSKVLRIYFLHGGVYDYFNVLKPAYEGLINDISVGRYYQNGIKGTYLSRKVDPDTAEQEYRDSLDQADKDFFEALGDKKSPCLASGSGDYLIRQTCHGGTYIAAVKAADILKVLDTALKNHNTIEVFVIGEKIIDWKK